MSTRRRLPPIGGVLARTLDGLFTDRVSGLAAEAAFFALLSLPPLLLAVVGTIGYFHGVIGPGNIASLQNDIARGARTVLTPSTVNDTVMPIVRKVLNGGRADAVSIGFVLSLWSGSRAMSTYMDAITIAYDLEGRRSWLTKRVLAYLLYAGAVFVGIVILPLLVIGPRLAQQAIDKLGGPSHLLVTAAYWPIVVLLSIAALTTLYHVAVPVRIPWRRGLPGAVIALLIWVGGSFLLRLYLDATVHPGSAYGSLAAPVAVLLWLYVTALAVLIGAELNSAVDQLFPPRVTRSRPDFLGRPQRLVERRLGLRGPDAPPAEHDESLPAAPQLRS